MIVDRRPGEVQDGQTFSLKSFHSARSYKPVVVTMPFSELLELVSSLRGRIRELETAVGARLAPATAVVTHVYPLPSDLRRHNYVPPRCGTTPIQHQSSPRSESGHIQAREQLV